MKLIRYHNPNSRVSVWDPVFDHAFNALVPLVHSKMARERAEVARTVEWFEDDDNYYARVEVPGFKREQIRLDAEGGMIRITCETVVSDQDPRSESRRLEQVLRYPEGVRVDGIEARLADGILQLTLPKEDVRKPVMIEIR